MASYLHDRVISNLSCSYFSNTDTSLLFVQVSFGQSEAKVCWLSNIFVFTHIFENCLTQLLLSWVINLYLLSRFLFYFLFVLFISISPDKDYDKYLLSLCLTDILMLFLIFLHQIEAIMNDFIQLEPQSNVYEAETMVEGYLHLPNWGFYFW